MKIFLLSFILLTTFSLAKEATSFGGFYGSIKDYFPNVIIKKVTYYHNSGTTGISKHISADLNDMIMDILTGFLDDAKKNCKDNYGYALDNIHVNNQVFGEYNNQLVHVSANVVCFEK